MNKKILIFLLAIMQSSNMLFSVGMVGTHIVNQTNQPIRAEVVTPDLWLWTDIISNGSYFYSQAPQHLNLYGPNGFCSQFRGIAMNGSIFNYVLVRAQTKNPGCYILGFTGKTRTSTPATVRPVAIEPDSCKRGCWNPSNGWIASNLATKTAPVYVPQGINQPAGSRTAR
jgi:hypothetical protein